MAIETWSPQGTGLFSGFPQKPEGEGWTVTGYRDIRTQNPRFGSGYSTSQVPIYTRSTKPAPAPAPAAPAAPKLTIRDLYQTVLGREPDPEGASYWETVFGPEIDAAEAAAFGIAAGKELNPPPAQTAPVETASQFPTPTYEPPPDIMSSGAQAGPDFATMFANLQDQTQSQLAQIIGPLMQTISQVQNQIIDEGAARQEDYRRMAEASRAAQINQARSQAAGNLQIQPASTSRSAGGTEAFKIRRQRSSMLDQNIPDQFINTLNI